MTQWDGRSAAGEDLLVERRGAVALLTLNRPDTLNALSHGLVRLLHTRLEELDADLACRVILLEGAGRAFSAGTDLKEQANGAEWQPGRGRVQGIYELQRAVAGIVVRLRQIHQPVIAVIRGVAAGGGMSLACAADVRIAEPDARFNAAFVRIGASGGDLGSSYFLPRLVGCSKAAELLYTGRMVDAEEARRIGLVSEVVAKGAGRDTALRLAEEIAATAPFSTRMTKSLLNLAMDGASLDQVIELENRTQALLAQTADFEEGARAFVERRPPAYRDQ